MSAVTKTDVLTIRGQLVSHISIHIIRVSNCQRSYQIDVRIGRVSNFSFWSPADGFGIPILLIRGLWSSATAMPSYNQSRFCHNRHFFHYRPSLKRKTWLFMRWQPSRISKVLRRSSLYSLKRPRAPPETINCFSSLKDCELLSSVMVRTQVEWLLGAFVSFEYEKKKTWR